MISPAPAGETEHNGVTFTSNGDGTYKIKGTASAYTTFVVNVEPFTIPISVEKGGNGVMVLNNSFVGVSGVGIGFYYNGTVIDTWGLNSINRISNGYTAMGGKLCNKWSVSIPDGASVDGTIAPMFRCDGVNTSGFVPFTGYDVVEVTWQSEAGTVYGGTLDVTTGVLTVDKGIVDLGSLSWGKYTGTQTAYFRASVPGIKPAANSTSPDGISCSVYRPVGSTYVSYSAYPYSIGVTTTQTADYIYVQDLRWDSADSFKTNASGVMFVYPLKNPQTVQLTPTEVSTLLGANNIWADTGDVSVTYRADSTLYIDKLTGSTEEDMIADAPIASGKYFLVGNRLFLSTASIAAGATLTPGTNCTETNLAAALNAINS
jgi:hypothetical protein